MDVFRLDSPSAGRTAVYTLPMLRAVPLSRLVADRYGPSGPSAREVEDSLSRLVRRKGLSRKSEAVMLTAVDHEVERMKFAFPSSDDSWCARALSQSEWSHKTAIVTLIERACRDTLPALQVDDARLRRAVFRSFRTNVAKWKERLCGSSATCEPALETFREVVGLFE